MATTASLTATLLATNADINYYTQQQIYWANKYEANQKLLNKQVKYEEQWEKAYSSVYDCDSDNKSFKVNGKEIANSSHAGNADKAKEYADLKVWEYDEDRSTTYAELDVSYATTKETLEVLLETLRSQKESEKTAVDNAAQDNPISSGGQ